MCHGNRSLGTLVSIILLAGCVTLCFGSPPQLPQSIATLDLSELLPSGRGTPNWVNVTFLSETSIGVGLCRVGGCSLSIVRLENGVLRRTTQVPEFSPGASLRAAGDGRMLVLQSGRSTILYSADLSTRRELSERISLVSASGKTTAVTTQRSWKLYRLTDRLEPLREGAGNLQSVSDKLVVLRFGKVIKVETLEGKELGSLSAPLGESGSLSVGSLGADELYLDDCKTVKVVDFEGRPKSSMRTGKGCSSDDTKLSTDGKRVLFDFVMRKVSKGQRLAESIRTITTLGMAGPEDVNTEQVQVFDTESGERCFEWYRHFPMTYSRMRSAAIAPSGDIVGIVAENSLAMYRVPEGCKASVPQR